MTDAQHQPQTHVPAGWFADPSGAPTMRWWNGTAWTNQTAPMPAPTAVPTPAPQRIVVERNVFGAWSIVVGIVALVIPFNTRFLTYEWNVVILGLVASGGAIWLGVAGLRRARLIRSGFGSSATGLAIGGGALVFVLLYVLLNIWSLF